MAASTSSAQRAMGLHSHLIALLSDSETADLLNGDDLVTIALFLKPDALVTPVSLLATLERAGFQPLVGRRQLELALLEGARANPALEPTGDALALAFALAHPAQIQRAAERVCPRFELAGSHPEVEDGPPSGQSPRRRRPRVRGRSAEGHPGIEVTPELEAAMQALSAAFRQVEQGDPPSASRPTRQAKKTRPQQKRQQSARPSAKPGTNGSGRERRTRGPLASSPDLELSLPPAASPNEPRVRCEDLPVETLAALYELPGARALDLSLLLRAHEIAAASQFQELLCLATLTGVESHAYQIETVRRVLRIFRGRALLADEVGLGKTIEAMLILREYQTRGLVRRCLVLTPPALVRHWTGELLAKSGISARSTLDRTFRSDERFWEREGVVVASMAAARAPRHAEAVREARWDLVIVDEAHHVKNRRTLAWQLVNAIKSRFLLLLTATPVETDLEELYNLVTLLKPGQFATPSAFRRLYIDPKHPTSPLNRDRLRGLLSEVMVRNTRAQSGLKLPPRFVTTLALEPTEQEQRLYAAALAFTRKHAEDGKARRACATLLLEAGSAPAALLRSLERYREADRHGAVFAAGIVELLALARDIRAPRKDQAVFELLEQHGRQALVFTRFRASAETVSRFLEERGVEVVHFHGGLSAQEKQQNLEAFRNGARCLVATDVGGEGQNLQFCQLLINYDLPWNPMAIEQRIGRLHRMGQTEPVRVFNLCARGTVEERLLDVLDRRVHLFELVVGEMDMVLGNLQHEQDFEQRIFDIYTSTGEESRIADAFDVIAQELSSARTRYEKSRELDEALFQKDYEA